MELNNNERDQKYKRAKRRVKKLRNYYIHLGIFITVIISTSIIKVVYGVKEEVIYGDFDTFTIWIWWGLGIVFHTFKVFGPIQLFLSKDWEDQKIKEYMNKE